MRTSRPVGPNTNADINVAVNEVTRNGLLVDQQETVVVDANSNNTLAINNDGSINTNGLTDAQLRASAVPVSFASYIGLTDSQLRASPLSVSVTNSSFELGVNSLVALENVGVTGSVSVSNFTDNGLTDAQLRASAITVHSDTQPLIDSITGSAITMDVSHYAMHRGAYFSHSGKLTLQSQDTYDHLLMVGGSTYPHIRIAIVMVQNAPFEMSLYEIPIVSANGTQATDVHNHNRNSSKTSGITIYHQPTVTSVGTELRYQYISGNTSVGGGTDVASSEFILKPNTLYLHRIKNLDGNNTSLSYTLEWYEANQL